ncbi:hypothetical protein AQS8620_02133 [Aquimixticola soesokkakensis]|uniref:Alginate export domain-containing protein n=1 Tax=Aquimixticola soesokkakensis TaxID=1519096 RepID=A0A1Y5SVZ7_9RHOB|nr:hypothetical protein [Aquimixticola soesokkakensis]SLN49724.1 hypothetical protein AQS8620_02133 [Aquimixticola soesokkakensis]
MGKLRTLVGAGVMLGAAAIAGGMACAQELDTTTIYTARTTVPAPGANYEGGDRSDNDIFALDSGLTWRSPSDPRDGVRVKIRTGVRNEDWTGTYPPLAAAEYLSFGTEGHVQSGWGGRLDWAQDRTVTLDGFYARQTFEERSSLRLMAGIGALAQPERVAGRDALTAYALAEKSWYYFDDLVVRAGTMVDESGVLVTGSAELKLFHSPYFFGLEWTQAPWSYRDEDGYNDLTGYIRYVVPVGGNASTMLARDRYTPLRLGHRYAGIQ